MNDCRGSIKNCLRSKYVKQIKKILNNGLYYDILIILENYSVIQFRSIFEKCQEMYDNRLNSVNFHIDVNFKN